VRPQSRGSKERGRAYWRREPRRQARCRSAGAVGAGLIVPVTRAGCAAGAGPTVVLERGHLGPWQWQLVAWEQDGQLDLGLDGASQKTQYSGGVGFSADPSAGNWRLLPTSLSDDQAAPLHEHGSAAVDDHGADCFVVLADPDSANYSRVRW
jgi:hypothetical protein